jgi:formylglycine-generating enzyme required for sulfatase activity
MGCGSELILGDRYRCLRLIGQGGFGRTFLAQDEYQPSKPRCVLKQLYPVNAAVQAEALSLFQQESVRLAQLGGHPQIPSLHKHFHQQEYEYIAQELIDGDNLVQELAAKGKTFNEAEIRSLLTDVLPILTFIHQAEVIHRDIKPANIIRRRLDGQLCLVDFGAAKYATATALAKTGTSIGSAEYVAPEQARGKALFASDIYSLGITCLHLLTSVSPFDLFDMVNGEWIWRQYLGANPVSTELGQILDRMVQNLLKDRYCNAAEIYTALTEPIRATAQANTNLERPPREIAAPVIFQSPTPRDPTVAKTRTLQQVPARAQPKSPVSSSILPLTLVKSQIESVLVSRNGWVKSRHQQHIRLWREPLGGLLWKKVYLEMVAIASGSFVMGAPSAENKNTTQERPMHPVAIQPFYLGQYPITQRQYQIIMGDNPASHSGDMLPIENVNYYQAVQFCAALAQKTGRAYRLPSEAEWEYACRAGSTTAFSCGMTMMSDLANFDGRESYHHAMDSEYRQETTLVGMFPPNAFGLYDMHGNVAEWCSDHWHDSYEDAPGNGQPWLDGEVGYHPIRGGAWSDPPVLCRCAARSPMSAYYRDRTVGFRVALSRYAT